MSATAKRPEPVTMPDLRDFIGVYISGRWILIPNNATEDEVHWAFEALEWLAQKGKRPD
jgi:hypothetical protein